MEITHWANQKVRINPQNHLQEKTGQDQEKTQNVLCVHVVLVRL